MIESTPLSRTLQELVVSKPDEFELVVAYSRRFRPIPRITVKLGLRNSRVAELEKKLNELASECGCKVGFIFMSCGAIALLAYSCLWPASSSPEIIVERFILSLVAVVALGMIGKFLKIGVARASLRKACLRASHEATSACAAQSSHVISFE